METRLIGGQLVWDEDQANVARDMGNLNLDDENSSRFNRIRDEKANSKLGKGLASMGVNTFAALPGGAQSTSNLQNPPIIYASSRVGKKQNKVSPGRKNSGSRRRLVSPPPKIDGFVRDADCDPVPVMKKSDTEKKRLSEMRQRKILAYKQEVQKEHRAQRVRERRRNLYPYGSDFDNGINNSTTAVNHATPAGQQQGINSEASFSPDDADDDRHVFGKKVAFAFDTGSDRSLPDILDTDME